MLVLQRKKGETLLLGDNIRVTVVETTADGVKLAIEAPKDVKILREELVEAAQANKDAVTSREQMKNLKNILKK